MKEVGKIREQNYSPKKDKSKLYITIAIFSFFIGIWLIMFYFQTTFITFFSLSKFLILFTISGFLIPLKFYTKAFNFIKYETILFNILGVGPFLSGIFLMLNFLFNSNHQTSLYEFNGFKTNSNTVELLVIDNTPELPEEAFVCPPEILHQMRGNVLEITTADGFFGYKVIVDRKIVAKSN